MSVAAGGKNILCLWCMDELAVQIGLPDTAVALHFAGRGLHGSSDVRFAECTQIAVRSALRAALTVTNEDAREIAKATQCPEPETCFGPEGLGLCGACRDTTKAALLAYVQRKLAP